MARNDGGVGGRNGPTSQAQDGGPMLYRDTCGKCGARRVDNQIGLEESPELYVAKLVEVFREVRRVLHPTGVLWCNIGDSYAGSGGPGSQYDNKAASGYKGEFQKFDNPNRAVAGIKNKDLIGIPWMLAFALRADGWYLRSAITWCKSNPMPESVLDRCTSATEMVFMLAKSQTYFYDAEAVREDGPTYTRKAGGYDSKGSGIGEGTGGIDGRRGLGFRNQDVTTYGRNRRNWWVINSEPYSGAHFATMPTKLVEPCILAGSKPGDTVLDPFSGAATTGYVALKFGRKYIGLELNESYIAMSHKRLLGVASQRRLFEGV